MREIQQDINLKKIEKLIFLSYINAIQLHKTSLQIFNAKNYGLAHFLSAISLEEMGKAFLLSDFIWDSRFNGRYNRSSNEESTKLIGTTDSEEYFLRQIFTSHPLKQKHFVIFGHSDFSYFSVKKEYYKKEKSQK